MLDTPVSLCRNFDCDVKKDCLRYSSIPIVGATVMDTMLHSEAYNGKLIRLCNEFIPKH